MSVASVCIKVSEVFGYLQNLTLTSGVENYYSANQIAGILRATKTGLKLFGVKVSARKQGKASGVYATEEE
jgi:hypothetical protein